MSRKKKVYDDDDGRIIVNMNVDGMPWYMPKTLGDNRVEKRSANDAGELEVRAGTRGSSELTRKETFQIMLASMKWAFIATSILSVGMILFILFCTEVWFR